MPEAAPASVREGLGVLAALAVYRCRLLSPTHAELVRWRRVAAAIPDPELRRAALAALDGKRHNVEATATLALLAPRRGRGRALRAITALQIATDYLDTLSERATAEPLASSLLLHRALGEALDPGAPCSDWYELYPQRDDGGYLTALVHACRGEVAALPGREAVLPAARRAAERCGEGQSRRHALGLGDGAGAEDWAQGLGCGDGYLWWEVAAGACSSVAAHALIAIAADPAVGTAEAELVDAAYFPPIGALTVLLDDLVDRDADASGDGHSYLADYPDGEAAAGRLAFILAAARRALAPLRNRRHAAILTGVVGFYLSEPAARQPDAALLRERLLRQLGAPVQLVLVAMRVLRRG